MPDEKPNATTVATRPPQALTFKTDRGEVALSLTTVRQYFCARATDAEAALFMTFCQYHQLNPFLREAYLIKYDEGPAQIAVGRDAHARRAEEHPEYAGDTGGVIVLKKDGTLVEREGEFYLPDQEQLVGAWAKVRRKDRTDPIIHRVRLAEWDKGRSFWKTSPAHMIVKVAKAQCRHEAFPKAFSGMFSEDEVAASRGIVEVEIPEPLSVAEAAARATEDPPPMSEADKQAAIETELLDTLAHPEPQEPVLTQAERTTIVGALMRKAKAENKSHVLILKQLTKETSIPSLTDAQYRTLGKALGAL